MSELSLISFLVQTGTVVGASVWVIASIKSTTAVLSNTLMNLKESIRELTITLNKITDVQHIHETRISLLESYINIKK